jgi:transcriptional regulator with XRE-family HTH domain
MRNENVLCEQMKQQLAVHLCRAMKRKNISQAELARRMKTSRAVVHKLVNLSDSTAPTLNTIAKAAVAAGIRLQLKVVRARS